METCGMQLEWCLELSHVTQEQVDKGSGERTARQARFRVSASV